MLALQNTSIKCTSLFLAWQNFFCSYKVLYIYYLILILGFLECHQMYNNQQYWTIGDFVHLSSASSVSSLSSLSSVRTCKTHRSHRTHRTHRIRRTQMDKVSNCPILLKNLQNSQRLQSSQKKKNMLPQSCAMSDWRLNLEIIVLKNLLPIELF